MMGTLFKLGAAVAALVLLERVRGVKVLADELNVKFDAKGCGACYRFIHYSDGTLKSERVSDELCRSDGLDGLGCPGDAERSDQQARDNFAPSEGDFLRGVPTWTERQDTPLEIKPATQRDTEPATTPDVPTKRDPSEWWQTPDTTIDRGNREIAVFDAPAPTDTPPLTRDPSRWWQTPDTTINRGGRELVF